MRLKQKLRNLKSQKWHNLTMHLFVLFDPTMNVNDQWKHTHIDVAFNFNALVLGVQFESSHRMHKHRRHQFIQHINQVMWL
mmetsp:Transcript_26852/g.43473  ORF Transcript_26852/g.43473 Transcript_26852/m.43473 type:complete len:81 (-) Transcript_26852:284-526(-)